MHILKPELATGNAKTGQGLGAFGGVFTPSILTILGVIMYLRFGWVVGNAGLRGTLIIVTVATSITFLTALSIAQIATDQRVKTGGAYYMISRSLGVEVGGAIGLPLYFAQALSVALYTIGFAESLHVVFPATNEKLVAAVTTLLVTILALVSARAAIKAQYFIMAGIGISLVSLFLGEPLPPASVTLPSVEPVGFWVVFAVFFPAVTGIMAGVNMSGDLADPRRAIPRGTLAAVGVSYLVYMSIPFLLTRSADTATLISDPLIMRRIAWSGNAILVGVWGATLSSALGSILGAPRILQALARDKILPRPFQFLGSGTEDGDEPRIGTVVSFAIALIAISLGDLNVLAPILTMFFLATYAVINVVSSVERFLRNPSFRPTFKVHWGLSLLGAVGCTSVMFLINPLATVLAGITMLAIYLWLRSRGLKATWGDLRQGAWQAIIRWGLLNLRSSGHAKAWRPNVLVLAGSPAKRWYLIELANTISHDRGILSIATILPEPTTSARKSQLALSIREHLEERSVEALVRVVSASSPYQGAGLLVEAYGLGSLVPNTVMLGDGDTTKNKAEYASMVARIHEANRNIVIVRAPESYTFGAKKRIDVWLHGLRGNGSLMLTLAHLLATSLEWRQSKIVVRMIVRNREGAQDARTNLVALIETARIAADVEVIVDERPALAVIAEVSQYCDIAFLGLPTPTEDKPESFAASLAQLQMETASIPSVAFVLASSDGELQHILE